MKMLCLILLVFVLIVVFNPLPLILTAIKLATKLGTVVIVLYTIIALTDF